MMRLLPLIAIAFSAMAQPAMGQATVDITPQTSPIASPITARLSIRLAAGERVRLPKNPPLPDKAELLDMKAHPSVPQSDGGATQVVEYIFMMYKVGKAEFPAVTYEIVGEEEKRRTLSTDPGSFEIITSLTDPKTADQPIEIRPPVDLPFDWKRYLLPTLALLAAVIIGALMWRKFSTRRRIIEERQGPPPVPPHLEAFDSLAALKSQDMFARGHGRKYFFLLSDIIRKYVEGRYGAPALERTTDEFEREFDLRYERKEKRDKLMDLMRTCDMIKFANQETSREEGDRAFDQAWAWVEETKPRKPTAPEEKEK
ncbi:MAG: hypothetical protein OEZ32_03100 [Nitrospinota bacterium]|nr:hypothetical protein [Nitrospinota bacterium]